MSFQLHPSSVRVAERLKNPQLINGVLFDGTEPVDFYTVTNTPPAIKDKIVEIYNYEPRLGAQIAVKFPDGNTAQNPTLNVNGYGPIPIQYCGQNLRIDAIKPGHTYTLAFDGNAYQIISGYTDTPEVRQLVDDLDDKQTKALIAAKTELQNNINALANKEASDNAATNKRIDDIKAVVIDGANSNAKLRSDLTSLAGNTFTKDQTLSIIKNTRNTLKVVHVNVDRTINTAFTNPTNVDGTAVIDATNNSDNGTFFNVASGKVVTIPKSVNGFHVYIRSSSGTVTVRGSGCTIDGNASITLSKWMCVLLISDGNNYYSLDTSARFQ